MDYTSLDNHYGGASAIGWQYASEEYSVMCIQTGRRRW